MSDALVTVIAIALGVPAGVLAVRIAARVLDERDEDLPPMPVWATWVAAVGTPVVFGFLASALDHEWLIPAYVWFAFVTVTLIATDIHSRLIPDRISFPGTYVAAALLVVGAVLDGSSGNLTRSAIGAAIYLGIALLLYLPGGGKNFGGGDVKLTPLLGMFTAFLGWDVFVTAIVLGFFIGGIAGILLVVTRARGLRDHFAYGPPLTVGAYAAIVWGDRLVDWYLG